MNYSIRSITQKDEPFLWQMLYEAAHMAEEGNLTIQNAINHPELARYVKNWGANGDMGFIASSLNSNQPVGAAWIRLLTGENRGYGYINDETPELAIAILPEYRNQGIGTQLLTHLLAAAKAFYPSISLSIRSSNPALRLYRKFGWQAVDGSEVINRVGGTSFKMQLDLS